MNPLTSLNYTFGRVFIAENAYTGKYFNRQLYFMPSLDKKATVYSPTFIHYYLPTSISSISY